MSRTRKVARVRCRYCGHAFPPKLCKRWRDGHWYCPDDTGKQSVRGRRGRLSHRTERAANERRAAHERLRQAEARR